MQNRENIVMTYVTVEVSIAFSKTLLANFGASINSTNEYIKNPVPTNISKKQALYRVLK